MRKIKIFLPIIILLLSIISTGCIKNDNTFYLNDQYYGSSKLNEIDGKSLENLIEEKETFAIFVYQPLCAASEDFKKVLTTFTKENQISFYKITYAKLKETSLKETIKYYPTLIIIKEGEVVDFLETDSAEDYEYYKSSSTFKKWFTKYVKLIEPINVEEEEEEINPEDVVIDVVYDDIVYDENKVNIYLFWGDGCSHCKALKEFLGSIENEYGKYYTLHKYETWYDETNKKAMDQFSAKMGVKATGVPYMIIGEKVFSGYSKSNNQEIIDAIVSQHKNSYDVYFDKD